MVREAVTQDLNDILDIYNNAILEGTASFEESPLTHDEGTMWLESHHKKNYPFFVFQDQEKIKGFACLSPFGKKRETAYRLSAELSIYVGPNARGLGVGTELMKRICDYADNNEDLATIISVITKGNDDSIGLHEKFGFSFGGGLNNVAIKHEQTLDILFYQKIFNSP